MGSSEEPGMGCATLEGWGPLPADWDVPNRLPGRQQPWEALRARTGQAGTDHPNWIHITSHLHG